MATILDLIGNTPMAEIKKMNPNPKVRIFGKLEGNNPGGSVKDRPAKNMIASAVGRGDIKPGMKLIEATSGNTGIALAMIACLYGLEIELVMPSNSTRERTLTMEAFGAKVTLLEGIEACRDYAEEKGASGECFLLNQFANPDNYLAHYKTTGPEIWKDTEPERVDRVIDISEMEATLMARRLAKEEGIFAGMSSGGAMAGALKLASELTEGTIVFICCDRGDRYLSSDLFGR
jgi:S-sulfo-L-cysteine synthase (O-acetyl-L-serine-dependent)